LVASSLSICFWISSSSILAKAILLRLFAVLQELNQMSLKSRSKATGFYL
jgi:hypothetical protein